MEESVVDLDEEENPELADIDYLWHRLKKVQKKKGKLQSRLKEINLENKELTNKVAAAMESHHLESLGMKNNIVITRVLHKRARPIKVETWEKRIREFCKKNLDSAVAEKLIEYVKSEDPGFSQWYTIKSSTVDDGERSSKKRKRNKKE